MNRIEQIVNSLSAKEKIDLIKESEIFDSTGVMEDDSRLKSITENIFNSSNYTESLYVTKEVYRNIACEYKSMIAEIWKPVIINKVDTGWKVSNMGRLMNTKGGINIGNMGREYYAINIKGKTKTVHRLVAEAFCDKKEGRNCVNHIDHNKLNNCSDNLEWVTHAENMQKAHAFKKFKKPRRTTMDEIKEILRLKSLGHNHTKIGEMTNIDRTIVYKIINGTIWSKVTGMGYDGDTTLDQFVSSQQKKELHNVHA